MTLFDLIGGLILLVSALVGWIRGGTRELSTVLAFIFAAVIALAALRLTGPIARHAIHTAWLANIIAILVVFVLAYILLRVIAGAVSRRLNQTAALGTIDRFIGIGFGLVRALVVLGLFNLLITAATPADRMPHWISGAVLYPVSTASARVLRAFAPQGMKIARQVAPVVKNAVTDEDDSHASDQQDSGGDPQDAAPSKRPTHDGRHGYDAHQRRSMDDTVEQSR